MDPGQKGGADQRRGKLPVIARQVRGDGRPGIAQSAGDLARSFFNETVWWGMDCGADIFFFIFRSSFGGALGAYLVFR